MAVSDGTGADAEGNGAPDARPCLVPLYPEGPAVGSRFILERPALLGSDPVCDLRLPGSQPRHVRLEPGLDGVVVVPLGASASVNERPAPPAVLTSGDTLRLDACLVRYLAGPDVERLYHEEIYRLKTFDPWTGLHSLRYLLEFLKRELHATIRSRRPLTLARFELDDPAGLEALGGPLAAQLVLRQVAEGVKKSVRKADLLALAGPGRFAVVLYKARPQDAIHLTERLRRLVTEQPFRHGDVSYRATLSAGLVLTRGDPALAPDEFLALAEGKLRLAQAEGGNRTLW